MTRHTFAAYVALVVIVAAFALLAGSVWLAMVGQSCDAKHIARYAVNVCHIFWGK